MVLWVGKLWFFLSFILITSIVKSQSGDGVRRRSLIFVSVTDGDELGSSGITAKRPRCTHGDVGPYVTAKIHRIFFSLIFVSLFRDGICMQIFSL